MAQNMADENKSTLEMNLADDSILVAAHIENDQIINTISMRIHLANVRPFPPTCSSNVVMPGIKRCRCRNVTRVSFAKLPNRSPRNDMIPPRRLRGAFIPVGRHASSLGTTSPAHFHHTSKKQKINTTSSKT
jgi:hypothetical protein